MTAISNAVDKLIADLNDRRGLGLDSVDQDTRNEIRGTWIYLIESELTREVERLQQRRVAIIEDGLSQCKDDNFGLEVELKELREAVDGLFAVIAIFPAGGVVIRSRDSFKAALENLLRVRRG